MEKFLKAIDVITERTGQIIHWLFLALTVTVSYDLLRRYFTGSSTFWAFDLNYMIYGVNFMLGAAYTLKYDAHVRVDFLLLKLSAKKRAMMEVLFYILIFFPMCLICFWASLNHWLMSVQFRETSQMSPWRPPIYPYKTVMPLAFLFLLLQGFALFFRNLMVMLGKGSD